MLEVHVPKGLEVQLLSSALIFLMKLTSPAFTNSESIPAIYSCKEKGISPELSFFDTPENAKSLALIMHDPDAPMPGGFTHWVLYNIDPKTKGIAENSFGGAQGVNSSSEIGYMGPCPPSGTHRYFFTVYALDSRLDFSSPPTKRELEEKMKNHIIDQAELIGTFSK